MKTEKHLQAYIKAKCAINRIVCHKMESKTARGWPDLLLLFRGAVFFVELKSPAGTGKLSALQQRCLNAIREAGGNALVVSNQTQADAMLLEVMNNAEY